MTAAGTAGTVLHCRAANAAAATSWSQQVVRLKRVNSCRDLLQSSIYCHRHDMAACCAYDNVVNNAAITAASRH